MKYYLHPFYLPLNHSIATSPVSLFHLLTSSHFITTHPPPSCSCIWYRSAAASSSMCQAPLGWFRGVQIVDLVLSCRYAVKMSANDQLLMTLCPFLYSLPWDAIRHLSGSSFKPVPHHQDSAIYAHLDSVST